MKKNVRYCGDAAMSIITAMIGARELIARARKRSSRASVAAAQVMMWASKRKKTKTKQNNSTIPSYVLAHASEVEKFLKRIDPATADENNLKRASSNRENGNHFHRSTERNHLKMWYYF